MNLSKYMETGKITFKSRLAYRFDLFVGTVLSIVRIILAYILWSVVYNGKNDIAGFTFQMMMTYYIVMSFFKKLDQTDSIVWQLSSEIRSGQFSKYLVKPVNLLGYFIANSFSKSLFVLGMNISVTFVFVLIFSRYFIFHTNAAAYAAGILVFILGLVFMILLNYLIAIMSFKFTDVSGFNIFKSTLMEFLTGVLVPLAVLPQQAVDIMRLFPFYYIYYLPALLFMDKGMSEFPAAILVLTAWNSIMFLIIIISYRHLLRKYEGVGI